MNQTVIRPDNPSVRGMIQKIRHLLDVEEISG
jgi:ribosomal protein L30/L7E